ncbi:filamentous hemagglutinin N-terminal domain-containing protein [Pleurocapsales cyanobacterium LEGE 06147]|nr:filamentous hemagglutinin N-terminal domain-containing protein [Pleurocapsales cyanobacterium LEGE 06147]
MKQIARSRFAGATASCFSGAAAPLLLFGSLALCSLIVHQPVRAQIAPDGTLSTTVNSIGGSIFIINDGDRAGGNLFHSFSEFSVPTNGGALFNNALDVQNIINRVTGGSVSDIDGLIRANGSANLFLLNPAGIIFGPNASLNIGGSFYGSTADSLVFPEGEFSATDTQAPPLLTINAPIGLNFRDNPQPITNQSVTLDPTGQFFVGLGGEQPGQNLALIGGDINLDGGYIVAPDGKVELGGLSAAGTVGLNGDGSLSFPEDVARADVSLTNGAFVVVSGISIFARSVVLTDNAILKASNAGEGNAGSIMIQAIDTVSFDNSFAYSRVEAGGEGNAGNIDITTGSFSIVNNSPTEY